MSDQEQFKEEALRLLDHYPLEVCERLARALQARGWELHCFNVDVKIFDSMQWSARVSVKTQVTKQTLEQKWQELVEVLATQDMVASRYTSGVDKEWETKVHRRYGYPDGQSRRLVGHWYEYHLEFKPARALEVSVLTEENV